MDGNGRWAKRRLLPRIAGHRQGVESLRRCIRACAQRGVRAEWMTPSFPSKTFPNHYTIVTGLYPEHHGIVANNIRDSALGTFTMSDTTAVRNPRWWGGEPIWVTAEKQGKRAATAAAAAVDDARLDIAGLQGLVQAFGLVAQDLRALFEHGEQGNMGQQRRIVEIAADDGGEHCQRQLVDA